MKHPSCDFPMMSVTEVAAQISRSLAKEECLSLVRLGDGEGLLLSISDQSSEADLSYMVQHLGTFGAKLENVLSLKNRLIRSIKSADIVGVRDDIVDVAFDPGIFSLSHSRFLDNFHRSFRLREVEKGINYHGARRIAFLHKAMCEMDLSESTRFCSAWFHYQYHSSGEFFNALSQQKRIGLISCRHQVPRLLEDLFDLSVKFYPIPDMFRDVPAEQAELGYIDHLEGVLEQQLVDFPGMLYLVGGGLYGKIYCQLIRSQGGIALDLGSLLDAWVGIASRPLVYSSMFNSVGNSKSVPPELALTEQNVRRLSHQNSD